MTNLINSEINTTALSLSLRQFLGSQMRIAKALPEEEKWNYIYIKETNRAMIDGLLDPFDAIKKIWGWYLKSGQDTSFDGIEFCMLSKKYGLMLRNNQ